MKKINKWYLASIIIMAFGLWLIFSGTLQKIEDYFVEKNSITAQNIEPEIITIPEKDAWKDGLRETPEFQNQIEDELEKRYWLEMQKRSNEELLKLQDKGFSGETVSAVRSYLKGQGSDLAFFADEIVKHPRWVEALAIIGKETSFCRAGVGDSRNNCGAIKNSQTGEFKVYANKIDAFDDVVVLLQKDLYKDKTIAEMNGTYCVHEESESGVGECPNWTEVIEGFINEIHLAMI